MNSDGEAQKGFGISMKSLYAKCHIFLITTGILLLNKEQIPFLSRFLYQKNCIPRANDCFECSLGRWSWEASFGLLLSHLILLIWIIVQNMVLTLEVENERRIEIFELWEIGLNSHFGRLFWFNFFVLKPLTLVQQK